MLIPEKFSFFQVKKMSRYFKENSISDEKADIKNDPEVRVYNVTSKDLKYVKRTGFNSVKREGIDYNDRKRKREKPDRFPGRKPVDKKKFNSHSRGHKADINAIKSRIKQKETQRQEKILEFAAEQAVRAEILLPEEAGYLETDEYQVHIVFILQKPLISPIV